MSCGGCGREIQRPYWIRDYPDYFLCRDCWMAPDVLAARLLRNNVARILWKAHHVDVAASHKALLSLRGTGIPAKGIHHAPKN